MSTQTLENYQAATQSNGLRVARLLSAIVPILMIAASLAGLLIDGVYRDDASVVAMLRGYDLVALVVAAPVLGAALLPSVRSKPRAQLLWVGMLAFSVYNYALYLFGTQYNSVFLLHVAVFTVSVYALALALTHLDVRWLAGRFTEGTPVRAVGSIIGLLAVGLGAMWVSAAVSFIASGQTPEETSKLVVPFEMTRLGHALDLSLLIPAYLLAAVLLWRRRAWGYLLSAMLLAAGVVHQLGYMTALVAQVNADIPGASAFDPIEPFIVLAYVAALALLLANVRKVPAPAPPATAEGRRRDESGGWSRRGVS